MRDRLLLPLTLFLLRALSPVGRVDAMLALNRMIDLDLVAETEKPAVGAAGGKEKRYVQDPAYNK